MFFEPLVTGLHTVANRSGTLSHCRQYAPHVAIFACICVPLNFNGGRELYTSTLCTMDTGARFSAANRFDPSLLRVAIQSPRLNFDSNQLNQHLLTTCNQSHKTISSLLPGSNRG